MPGMSGFEVCKALREKLRLSASMLPVLMLSARSPVDASVIAGLKNGCNDYISKPFEKEVLVARVKTALEIKRLHETELEHARHTELLYSIMPPHVIERLQAGESMIAESHDSVTVLFSDIVGWTNIAESLTTSQLVVLLNDLFSAFDDLTETHGVFKVETIGDAYMCAAGHDGSHDHALRMVKFGLAMIEATAHVRVPRHGLRLQIRVGAHTGPAYTGVVGRKVPRYCFFGDTVNVSSRMESHGSPGCLHLSCSTFEEIKNTPFIAESSVQIVTSTLEIKGKGAMQTHLVVPRGTAVPSPQRKLERRQSISPLRSIPLDGGSPVTTTVAEAESQLSLAVVEAKLREELQAAKSEVAECAKATLELKADRCALEDRSTLVNGELEAARVQALEQATESRSVKERLATQMELAKNEHRQQVMTLEHERSELQERLRAMEARATPALHALETSRHREAGSGDSPRELCTQGGSVVREHGAEDAGVASVLALEKLEKQLRHVDLEVKLKDRKLQDLRSELETVRMALATKSRDYENKDDELQHALLDLRR